MIEIEDRFYTSTEVADILGVSLRSIYRYLEEDKIQAEVKTVTGRHRFTKKNILDFLYPDEQKTEKSDKSAQATQVEQGVSSPIVTTEEVINSAQSQETLETTPTSVPAETQQVAPVEVVNNQIQGDQPQADVTEEKLPQDSGTPDVPAATTPQGESGAEVPVHEDVTPQPTEQTVQAQETQPQGQPQQQEVPRATPSQEDVDWLAKFRAAAEKYKAESENEAKTETTPVQAAPAPTQPTPEPASIPASQVASQPAPAKQEPAPQPQQAKVEQVSGLAQAPVEEKAKNETKNAYYYKSGVGGLKDIAQQIDKHAKKSSVNYAFTMSAGLSLHKPIKPFSLLHAYVKASDREFFEKMLQLTETDNNSAQLCLLISDDVSLYTNTKEMHGLNVVSDIQLKNDLLANGEETLAKEFESILG